MLSVRELALPGVLEIVPRRHGDFRGYFSESYNRESFAQAGITLEFVQDNHAHSVKKGVVRGFHYQLPPQAQDKLVRVARGRILDVVVDVRQSSPTFGRWLSLEISEEQGNQILIPKGYAHGLITLEDRTDVLYKMTEVYSPEHERAFFFDDPALGVDWPLREQGFQMSDKDARAPLLKDAEVFP